MSQVTTDGYEDEGFEDEAPDIDWLRQQAEQDEAPDIDWLRQQAQLQRQEQAYQDRCAAQHFQDLVDGKSPITQINHDLF